MSSTGKQKIFASEGFEEQAVQNYLRLKELIIHSTPIPFKEIIPKISGIAVGTFYGYISNSLSKRGHISLYVAENLANYFNLPIDLFIGKIPMSEEYAKIVIQKIKKEFSLSTLDNNIRINQTEKSSDEFKHNMETIKISFLSLMKEDNIELLNKALDKFKTYEEILANRVSDLEKYNNL